MRNKFGNIRAIKDTIVVRKLPDQKKRGSIWLPNDRNDSSFKSHVVQALAIGDGAMYVKKTVQHYYPGSKKWGEAKVEKATKKPVKETMEEMQKLDYLLLIHPFVCDLPVEISLDHPDIDKSIFQKDEISKNNTVTLYLIKGHEVAAILDKSEDEDEEFLSKIMSGQISIGG